MIVFLSDGREQEVGQRLYEEVTTRGVDARYISLEDKDIRPCLGCSSCSGSTFRRCVQKDGMEDVLHSVADCDAWLIITPVHFGGLSSTAKCVQERMVPLGDPRYYVRKGELVKGMGKGSQAFYLVGVKDHCSQKEKEVFHSLHRENVRIMNCPGQAFVVEKQPEEETIRKIVEVLLHDEK